MDLSFETFLKLLPLGFLIWGLILLIQGQKSEDGKLIHKGLTVFLPVIVVFAFISLVNKGIFILPNQPGFNINLFFFVCLAILAFLTISGIAAYYISKDVPEIISRAGIAVSSFAIVIFFLSISMSQKDGIIPVNEKGHEFREVSDKSLSSL